VSRLLGIDLGSRRIGLAVADTGSGSVRPLSTLRRADFERDAATLARVAAEQRVDEVVVGLPLNMDGSEGAQAAATREWAAQVAVAIELPLVWRDERLSSESAERCAGAPRRGRSGGPPSAAARNTRRARVDQLAAAQILQAELDARRAAATSDEQRG
jgi:putative Holliday junction resolvase